MRGEHFRAVVYRLIPSFLLRSSQQEKAADKKLTTIAESKVNLKAA
jgi:hypothetical protein